MKFLFISNSIPENVSTCTHGIYKRMGMFIEAIKDIAQVDMLFYVQSHIGISDSAVLEIEQEFREYWGAKINLFLCPRFIDKKKVSYWAKYGAPALKIFNQLNYKGTSGLQQVEMFETCLNRNPDAIFAHRLSAMMPLCLTRKKLPPVFFDLDDIEHKRFFREVGQPPWWKSKALLYLQLPALFSGEIRAMRLATQTFVCSDHDKRYLQRVSGAKGVAVMPNSVDMPELKKLAKAPALLFIGGYKYPPNVRAAEFLIKKVLPVVRREIPDACLIIAGPYPEKISCYSRSLPGVEFTGFVDNLDELYHRARVVCAPIFSGGGTRFKIVEAAAYAKPIVATTIGAEGLNMGNCKDLLICDDAKSFANTCVKLLNNYDRCVELGLSARKKAVQFYKKSYVIRLIQQTIKKHLCVL